MTKAVFEGDEFVFDIETGSLVTYPCPVRFVEIDSDQKAHITSRFIRELPSYTDKGTDFVSHARSYVYAGIEGIAIKTMVDDLGMKKEEAEMLSGQIADAFVAHYAGDEEFTGDEMLTTKGLSFIGKLVVGNRKSLIEGLWTDKKPTDNDLIIDLRTGNWEEK